MRTGKNLLETLPETFFFAMDYTISNASVANLLVISFDRYMSVTRPLTYRVRRTRRRAAAMIAGAWVVSTLLWTPWIVAWPYIEGRRTVPDDDCYISLRSNRNTIDILGYMSLQNKISIVYTFFPTIRTGFRVSLSRQLNLHFLALLAILEPTCGIRNILC